MRRPVDNADPTCRGPSTVTSLTDQSSLSSKLGALTTSVSAVEQAAAPIMNSARAGCPSVPPIKLPPPS